MVAIGLTAAGAMLGCAGPRHSESVPRCGAPAAAVADTAADSRKGTLLEAMLANRSAFAAMLAEEEWRLAYTHAATERVESLRKTVQPAIIGVERFKIAIALSRIVFVSDVHDDVAVQESIKRAVRWLRASGGKLDFVGLEFLYDEWLAVPVHDLPGLIEAEFGLKATGRSMEWLAECARDADARVLPLNETSFHSRACLDENGLWGKYSWLCYSDLISKRDRWAAERLNAAPGRGIVVYGRSHVVSGNLPGMVPGSVSVITADPELWDVVASKIDCSRLSAAELVVVELAPGLFLAHFP